MVNGSLLRSISLELKNSNLSYLFQVSQLIKGNF